MRRRGFVTIATGNDKYYKMASNLLASYRLFQTDGTPFAIICDRENEYTQKFDDVVVASETFGSYLDKLDLWENSPYDETVFVDADSLFLRDPKCLWEDFESADDFSAYGKTLPLKSREGWFFYEQTGAFKSCLEFCLNMHGGLYFFRKTARSKEIFDRAILTARNYSQYQFAHFSKPADEPVLALSMAVSKCHPCEKEMKILFFPSYDGRLRVTRDGRIFIGRTLSDAVVFHVGTHNIYRFAYRYLLEIVKADGCVKSWGQYWEMKLCCLPMDIKIPVVRFVKRTVKYSLPTGLRKKLLTWNDKRKKRNAIK